MPITHFKGASWLIAVAAGVAGPMLGATVANAAPVPLANGGVIQSAESQQWTVSWTDPTLVLTWDDVNKVLDKTVTFTSLSPIDIIFAQEGSFAGDPTGTPPVLDEFGLRFKMNATVKNMSGVNWTAFQEKLIDGKPVTAAQNPSANNAHPRNPHFHDDGSVFLNGGVGFNDDAISNQDADNKKNLWDFSNGPGVPDTKTWKVSNIGIHDWEVTAFERSFTLRELPTGVPDASSSALLLGLGLVGLVGVQRALGWRTRVRHRSPFNNQIGGTLSAGAETAGIDF